MQSGTAKPTLRWVALTAAVVIGACQPKGCEFRREGGVRRIVLISVDTLRADHLGAYGHVRGTSPSLDGLGARGVIFEDTSTTAPWTLPAHASILTGFYPEHTGARTIDGFLSDDVPTIAETLLAAGYRTAGLGNVIWFRPFRKLDRGFEKWKLLPESESPEGCADTITDFGIEFLEQSAGERAFLFLHYFDVHTPYHSRPSFEEEFLPANFRETSRVDGSTMQLGLAAKGYGELSAQEIEETKKLYDAGILQLDSELGRLFGFIEERFGFDDTLVIVTSDHGEAFLEHGHFSHGDDQFQEQLHVPLIARGGPVPEGVRITAPTSVVDVAPTIYSAANAVAPSGVAGVDLARYWTAPMRSHSARTLYGQSAPGPEKDTIRMARRGRFKLIADMESNELSLYDLVTDPGERHSLVDAQPELAGELSVQLRQFFARPTQASPSTLELDAETVERLRSLGYID